VPVVGGILAGTVLLLRSRRRPRLIGELVWRTPDGLERRRDLSRYRGSVDLGEAMGQPSSLKGIARLEIRTDPKARRSRALYLIPLRDDRVRCRGALVREPVRLHDQDEIEVDGFRVRFENLREKIGRSAWRMR